MPRGRYCIYNYIPRVEYRQVLSSGLFQGLDCVWSIQFQRQMPLPDQEESILLQKLQSSAGPQIAVPHVWGAIAERLEAYPRVKQWLYARIREGRMPERAYKELRCFIEREAAK